MMPDREKVIGHLNDCMEASRQGNTWVFVRKDIVKDTIALLKEQEIVRCKDCQHGEKVNSVYLCGKSRGFGLAHEPDWFCADGERRDDDA